MATSSAAVRTGKNHKSFDCTATADADTTLVITHGFGSLLRNVNDLDITLEPLLQASAALSGWAITARSATTITLTKGVGVGSGNAGAQLRVQIACRHTIDS